MRKYFSKGSILPSLSKAAQDDVRRQIGDQAFDRIVKKELKKTGRYTVGAKEKRTSDRIVFDSVWEARVYCVLRDRVGLENITLQPRFLLQPAFTDVEGKRVQDMEYVADFLLGPPRPLNDSPLGTLHMVCDSKGHLTQGYKDKRKIFKWHFKAKIHEIYNTADLDNLITQWKNINNA